MQPTSPEELRYYEVMYYTLLDRYFTSSDPTKLYNFIELMSVTFGLNNTLMTQATSAIMRNDFEFQPRPVECAILMSKFSKLSKREQAKRLNISPTLYYKHITMYEDDPFPIRPKLSADQTVEVAKAMKEYIYIARLM